MVFMEGDGLPNIVGLRDAAPSRACDLVVDQLRSLIIGGQLEPGSRLPAERDLALRFQTSRATISQALRILAALGLVEIHHGSGVYASPHPDRLLTHSLELILALDRPSMIRLCEVRGWLEVAAIARAAEIATPADVEAIRAELDRLASERRSVERWLAHDIEFHRAVLRATGNMIALSMVSSVLELMASARVREYREAGTAPDWFRDEWESVVAIHMRITDAIAAHDVTAAHAAAGEHQERLAHFVAEIDPWAEAAPRPRAAGRRASGTR